MLKIFQEAKVADNLVHKSDVAQAFEFVIFDILCVDGSQITSTYRVPMFMYTRCCLQPFILGVKSEQCKSALSTVYSVLKFALTSNIYLPTNWRQPNVLFIAY